MNFETPTIVTQINMQVGVQYNFQVLNSINAEKHKCVLEMYSWGVKVIPAKETQKPGHYSIGVYMTNIKWVDFGREAEEPQKTVLPLNKKKA
jgi:hypothetical protein